MFFGVGQFKLDFGGLFRYDNVVTVNTKFSTCQYTEYFSLFITEK